MLRYFLAVILFLVFTDSHGQNKGDDQLLFESMLQSIEKVQTCTFVLNLEERVFDNIGKAEFVTKVNVNPFKVYAYSVFPNPGAEALYVDGENNGKVLVNPNRFPFINLNLTVNSMLLRKRHQFSMLEFGFSYIHDILSRNMMKHGARFFESLSQKQDTTYNNHTYHVLEISNNVFGKTTYTVMEGENVTDIARKLLVNDHMILEMNENISDYDDVSKGQVIVVPNSFAKKIVLFIDKINLLPLVQLIYDDKGFYSKVEVSSFRMNPVIPGEEFSSEFSKYHF